MPKNKVNDPITDQEIVYARLILSGKMSDQEAAEVAGLNPSTAAYTKAKPRVQAWMQEHRAATEKQILEHESEQLRRKTALRERVLARLWDVADRKFEETKGNSASQVKALALIIAMEELIPDRRARSTQKATHPAVRASMYQAEWLRKRNAASESAAELNLHQEEQDNETLISHAEPASEAPDPSPQQDPNFNPDAPASRSTPTFAEENSSPYTSFVPDTRGAFRFPKFILDRRRH